MKSQICATILKKYCLLTLFALVLSVFSALAVRATDEYAGETGAECSACHIDALGGGELTDLGRGYLLSIDPSGAASGGFREPLHRGLRLVFLYVHIATAFLWFGTILYVHLVLKPAYASKGLPRGEVKVGLVSMGVMAVTGAVLTYYKVPDLSLFVESRFGMLLLAKICIFLVMAASALYVVFVIGPRLKGKKKVRVSDSGELSPAELAHFDGGEGRQAYFAYKGVVYDAGQSRLWKGGKHMARHRAGEDLTDFLAQAPHGEEKISAMPAVGHLSPEKAKQEDDMPRKVFFFMAYMNLGFVFIVSFILALWRW